MKSYNHLFEKFIDPENVSDAIKMKKSTIKLKDRWKIEKKLMDPYYDSYIWMYALDFKNRKHNPIEIYDGVQRKKRTIIVPTLEEQIIHHMIINVLKPIFIHGMYEHSYGSIPNRGPHKGKKTIEKWLKYHPGNCNYVLKMDIKKYFESIPHNIYLKNFEKIIHDKEFMRVIRELTNVMPDNKGLPLGFYTSQWTANWYLQGLDHYIKEVLKAKHYIRYMDDMVIFGPDKTELHEIRKSIEKFLNEELGLQMKENWQVFKFDYIDPNDGKRKGRFLDFMGFRFYFDRTTLRKSIMIKTTRTTRRSVKNGKPTLHRARSILSYMGWVNHTNSYNVYEDWIKPYVNIGKLKKRLSNHDKRLMTTKKRS